MKKKINEIGLFLFVCIIILWRLFHKELVGNSNRNGLIEFILIGVILLFVYLKTFKEQNLFGKLYEALIIILVVSLGIEKFYYKKVSLLTLGLIITLGSASWIKDEQYLSWRIKGIMGVITGSIFILLGLFVW